MNYTEFDSYKPLLTLALKETEGNVLQLGINETILFLHECCAGKRMLVSYDFIEAQASKYKHLDNDWHIVENVENWEDIAIENYTWSVALIDHSPGSRRAEEIKRLKDCEIIIVHDTQPIFGYEIDDSDFKYKVTTDYKGVQTTALSNTIDLTQWIGKKILGTEIEA